MHLFGFRAFLAPLCMILHLWQVRRGLLMSLQLFTSHSQCSVHVCTHPTCPFDFPAFLACPCAVLRLWQVTPGLLTLCRFASLCGYMRAVSNLAPPPSPCSMTLSSALTDAHLLAALYHDSCGIGSRNHRFISACQGANHILLLPVAKG
ncbi:hypothetical protein F5J12DRAFT_318552 [Pisolithus orientalis]|uniref:uncharacterized protein n=1 Tax=Pisolithus orientalis TaxID=936130 RepID=UPI0022246957|nr:uncharacterized protein F5J12DRAFT_318552 [Pisolithus orientalis]KAI5998519.1 hypothetical protein F5J12DRAFT_318552 [Pisolithus orientalis]